MLLTFTVLAGLKFAQFLICTVPTEAVKMKRVIKEVKKTDEGGEAPVRTFVEDIFLTEEDLKTIIARGCGDIIYRGAGLVNEFGPELVVRGELAHCSNCGKFKKP